MSEYLPKTTDYLTRFFSSKYEEYFEDMKELRPEKGYGYYYRSAEVTQSIRNIVHNISNTFDDMRIPEAFASPNILVITLINFKNLLERQNELFTDVFKHYESIEPPTPVIEISKINNEVLSAVEHVLSLDEIKPYLTSSEKTTDNILPIANLNKILTRFHIIATQLSRRHSNKGGPRPTLSISDEYDVQDLLHSLLRIEFDDIRNEEWTPSYAGGSARMDFLLKEEQIVVEVKKTRDTLKDKEIGEQLIIDKERYKHHPDCRLLICFIYDPNNLIKNPKGLIKDINLLSEDNIRISAIINPL